METADQQLRRVLLALEDLSAQEELLLRAEDFAAVPPLQRRAEPLVHCLVAGAKMADASFRERVSAVIAHRSRSAKLLSAQLASVRDELRTIQGSRHRIAQVAPAYRQRDEEPAISQLSVRG